jgi:hypothetical protein
VGLLGRFTTLLSLFVRPHRGVKSLRVIGLKMIKLMVSGVL